MVKEMHSENLNSIDVAKFMLAILVVAAHVHPFPFKNNIYVLLLNLAVPFFLLCTGYLIQKKSDETKNELTVVKIILL